MQPITTVPVGYLMAPIAAATVLTAMLFAGAWRAHQIERRNGRGPWWNSIGLAAYLGAMLYFLYTTNGKPAFNLFDVFNIAMLANAWALLTLFALIQGFLTTRGEPFGKRAFPMFAGILFLAGIIGAIFAQLPR